MDKILAEEVKTPQAYDDYGVSLVKTGDISKAEGCLEHAAEQYEKAGDIFKKNRDKTGSRIFQDHYAGGCEKLASIKKKLGETESAAALYREALAAREQLYKAEHTIPAAHALAVAAYNAASFFRDKEMMKKAYLLWKELSITHPEYTKYRDKAEKLSK